MAVALLRRVTFFSVSSVFKTTRTFCSSAPSESAHFEDGFSSVVTLSNGREICFSTGKFARMANGSSVVQTGDTAVMVTAVSKMENGRAQDFMPLTVDFRMKSAAAGRIPTNFLRREMGPSEREILTSRVIDRSIRPLFPRGYFSAVQIMSNLLAVDGIHDPEILCINAASMALTMSDIPWNGPVGAVRVGIVGDDIIINPTRHELQESSLNLLVAGKASSKVVMLEGSCDNIDLNTLLHAIRKGLKDTQTIVSFIQKIRDKFGKPKQELLAQEMDPNLMQLLLSQYEEKVKEIFSNSSHNKASRDSAVSNLKNEVFKNILGEQGQAFDAADIKEALNMITKKVFRDLILNTARRCDGRGLSDLRNISCEVGLFKPLHGSAVFQRGQTQVLCTVALDSPQSAIKTDSYTTITSGIKEKNFFLHYEFPAYATNEIGSSKGVSRREIGHGSLAERALNPVIPKEHPFSIRLTSEVLESNGSSSMATVCGGSLALLDAGVPITEPVAGVAMGLVAQLDDNEDILEHEILTDILGIEDYFGDMDFKVAGSRRGFTALQADFKIPGVSINIIKEALARANTAKKQILNTMNSVISKPREKEGYMPVLETFDVPPNKRSQLVGVGGVNMKKVFLLTGVQITPLDNGRFSVFAPNEAAMQEAHEIVRKILETEREPTFEFGAIYNVEIVEIRDHGVMVSLHPNMMPVLIHNSHLDIRKVQHPSALGLEVGQKIAVKYFGRDPTSGQIRLSKRVLQGSSGHIQDFVKTSVAKEDSDEGKS